MSILEQISKPIQEDIIKYQALFDKDFLHENPLLQLALQHIHKRQGKRLRPLLMMLVARCFGPLDDSVLHAAVAIELMHTASLVHDDIVDESDQRRGQASVNALLNNQAAVLVGDYLLSKSIQHASKTANLPVFYDIATITQQLSDGELMQMYNISTSTIAEEPYFQVIKRKTATLFSQSALISAKLAKASDEQIKAAELYGENLGLCFQIRDDIFDYEADANIGKPVGNDMREGKLTLPIIHAILKAQANPDTATLASEMNDLAMKVRQLEATEEDMRRLVNFAIEQGGVDYAYGKMVEFIKKATEQLALLPVSDSANALRLIAEYAIERKN